MYSCSYKLGRDNEQSNCIKLAVVTQKDLAQLHKKKRVLDTLEKSSNRKNTDNDRYEAQSC